MKKLKIARVLFVQKNTESPENKGRAMCVFGKIPNRMHTESKHIIRRKKKMFKLSRVSYVSVLTLLLVAVPLGVFGLASASAETATKAQVEAIESLSVSERREIWIEVANNIRGEVAYHCCLEDACWYCIQKTPGHGEGAKCECLQDVLNAENPCGECIGEIMEGHGLPALKPYFAAAIAEKVGMQHLEPLEKIIEDMYPE